MRLGADMRDILYGAACMARRLGHSYVGSAHLLLALTQERGICGQLLRCSGLWTEQTLELAGLLYGQGDCTLPLPQGYSHKAKRILRGAAREAGQLNTKQVQSIHVLMALLRIGESDAFRFFCPIAASGFVSSVGHNRKVAPSFLTRLPCTRNKTN